jgi:hypothetical protein
MVNQIRFPSLSKIFYKLHNKQSTLKMNCEED